MTGQIIQFDKYGDLPRGRLYRQQAVPRGLPPKNAGATAGKARRLERQVARISDLLNELEELEVLARTANDVPAAALKEARVGIERARAILRPLQASACKADDIEGDPQPKLNHEELERMYRALHPET